MITSKRRQPPHAQQTLLAALTVIIWTAAPHASAAQFDDAQEAVYLLQNPPPAPLWIDGSDSGWYDDDGEHQPNNTNYVVTDFDHSTGGYYRNFFVFDLSAVSQSVISATLRLWTGSYDNDSIDYTLFDVVTTVSQLVAGGATETAIYTDLGEGDAFSDPTTVTPADTNTFIEIALNAAGIADINSAAGGLWAIGGSGANSTGAVTNPQIFGGSNLKTVDNEWTVQLGVETVPEPFGSALVIFGVSMLLRPRRRA